MATRRHFSPEQKAAIVRRHLAGKELISNLAEELGVQPSQIHLWVKQVLDQAERAFQAGGRKRTAANPEQVRLAAREAALDRKDDLLGELLERFARRLVAPSFAYIVAHPGRTVPRREGVCVSRSVT